jgi:hypothetical protein
MPLFRSRMDCPTASTAQSGKEGTRCQEAGRGLRSRKPSATACGGRLNAPLKRRVRLRRRRGVWHVRPRGRYGTWRIGVLGRGPAGLLCPAVDAE